MEILADRGLEGLTTAEVARRLDVSQPTLYSHIRNLDHIRSLTAIRGMQELSERVRSAVEGLEGDDALRAMAFAYRGFVRDYPALYMLQQRAPSTEEFWEEAPRAARPVRQVLRSYGVPEDQVPHVHLVFRASIHGFVDQEINNAIPDVPDTDVSFELFLRFLTDGIKHLAAEAKRPRRR
ncbi:TetR family transcriptional regulator [Amycolatopsis sp. RM579]|uniref:TetR family transcriptional regulator n=1 Tax=Amycolatopsis pithecellobii TaxID=664692 RepID=A0A6N7YMB7_9PSEU|nr:TetR family transcriptional regulator [Amycolatopsis pithecellobii]